jgi:DNA-binding IscR family transcriptional regulator
VIRAVDGPLLRVRGRAPEEIAYVGSAVALQQVWVALQGSVRGVLERVTVADVAAGELPQEVLAVTRGGGST